MAVPAKISTAAATQVTVSTTAINFGEQFAAENQQVQDSSVWTINPEDGDIRVFYDGNTTTAALGQLLLQSQWLTILSPPNKISVIRAGGADVKVNVQAGRANMGGVS